MPDTGYLCTAIDGVPVVVTPAEIDITNANQLRAVLLDATSGGEPAVVVDMTRTQFCDSAGIHTLVRAFRRVAADDREIRLVLGADSAVPRMMTLTGVDRVIPCFTSLAEAIADTPDQADPATSRGGKRDAPEDA